MNKTIIRTLVSRNINCSELNVDDFVKVMFCDVLEAEEIYNENYCSEYVKSQINFYESKIKYANLVPPPIEKDYSSQNRSYHNLFEHQP